MVAEKGASGDFDYLREESDGSDGVDVFDEAKDHPSEADLDYLLAPAESQEHDGFDAFDEKTWGEVFTPTQSTRWYRSRQERTLLIASGAAISAIVVSVVLLVFRGSSPTEQDTPVPGPTTTPATTALATITRTSEAPPPPPPPPPPAPPPPEPSTMERAPAVNVPTVRPRQTKAPEIGVTRTPATRSPISVAPQPRRLPGN
jgi:hypothetical protein